MTVFETNILKNGKIIIDNLPEKVKTDLLERIAIYYSNKYLATLDVNNTMYAGIARNNSYVLYGFISCLESADIIDNNKSYILKNFIDILSKKNDIVNNFSDITIFENLLNYLKYLEV